MQEEQSPAVDQQVTWMQLEGIFHPYSVTQREVVYGGPDRRLPAARFVHYTSAEAALSIIKEKRVWMRNTNCMTDYKEVQHGFEVLQKFFRDRTKKDHFLSALNAITPGVGDEALRLFDQWWGYILFGTYVTSISEHEAAEDEHGRLSMWRAYGGPGGRVAMVFRLPWMSSAREALSLRVSPVAYLGEQEAHAELLNVGEKIREHRDFLQSFNRDVLIGSVFNVLMMAVTCLKHEGFHEEKEWRIIHVPQMEPSRLMQSAIKVVKGIPQIVYELPLDVSFSDKLADLDMATIFDSLIVGPSQFRESEIMAQAFAKALADAGVKKPVLRVSHIPIRS
jgi:hypothetical protein